MVLVGLAQSNQTLPKHDPPDMPFRRAPMGLSSRSIVVSAATNLHLAFDARLLRTHTVWAGESLNLFGPPYSGSANRFICDFTGTRLWGNPPFFPWSVDPSGENDFREAPPGSDFKGISTKGGVTTFIYHVAVEDRKPFRVHETSRSEVIGGHNVVVRRFEIGPCDYVVRLLAHAEMGKIDDSGDFGRAAAVIERESDCLLALARPDKKLSGNKAGLVWNRSNRDVDYQVMVEAEKGGRGPDSTVITNTVAGSQARLVLAIPRHSSDIAFEISTVVCRDNGEAGKLMPLLLSAPIKPPKMAFLSSREKDAQAAPPTVFRPAASFMDKPSGNEFYRVEHFPIPKEISLLAGGMDFLPNGDLAICTLSGEVYIVGNPQGPAAKAAWRRFARGLNEPMGLKVVNGQIYVVQKCELTRLVDTDGNGEADLFESINDDWGYNGNYHSFATGPVLDDAGNFYVMLTGHRSVYDVPFLGWCVRLKPGMKNEKFKMQNADGNVALLAHRFVTEGFCSGLRMPNGSSLYEGDIFLTDNQGHWIPANKLNHLQPGKFYGHPSAKPSPFEQFNGDTNFTPPAVWFPYAWVRSASDIVTVADNRFGPFKGQMLVGEFQNANVVRVALEKVNGQWQGAVFPFVKGFNSGVNRLVFGPDGKLYVGGLRMGHWTSIAPNATSLDRVSFTGQSPFEIKEVHARPDGFELTFTQPVEVVAASNPESYDTAQYGYVYQGKHDGPENDHDAKVPGPPVHVTKADVSTDRLKVRLKTDGCQAGQVVMVRALDVTSADGKKLWHDTFHYTLNQLPK